MNFFKIKTRLLPDLFFCVVFMPILVALGPARHWAKPWPVFFILVCAFMYACYFLLLRVNLPKMLISRKYLKLTGVIAALVGINYLLTLYPLPDMDFVTPSLSEYQTRVRNFGVSVSIWMMFSLVLGYSVTMSFVKELYEQLLLTRKIEMQRDKAELSVFKAQISPHFMFNTLNSLYSLVIGTSEKAEDAFIKFTELLKYTYVTIQKETVTLDEEIEYISNYIDLQLIRLNHHTTVVWNHNVGNGTIKVPPMLMLTFVENAFKYGASTSKDCTIEISIALEGNTIRFSTRNSVMKHANEFRKEMPVGIENCKARLASLYPGKHTLDARETGDDFIVSLTIDLS